MSIYDNKTVGWLVIGAVVTGLGFGMRACSDHFEEAAQNTFQAATPEQQLASIKSGHTGMWCKKDIATETGSFTPETITLDMIAPEQLRAKKCKIVQDGTFTLLGTSTVSPPLPK